MKRNEFSYVYPIRDPLTRRETTTGITIHPMASEEISLRLGIAGVWWALSMSCLLIGVSKFTAVKRSERK